MTVHVARLFCECLLAAVFLLAGGAKLFDLPASRKVVSSFGVPAFLADPIGSVLPAMELLVAFALMLTPVPAWWGAIGAFALLLVFLVAMIANLRRGHSPDCNCFGQIRSRPIGWETVARNVVLASVAGFVVWSGPAHATGGLLSMLATRLEVRPFAFVSVLVGVGGLTAFTGFLWLLFRQQGRLLLRVDELERRVAPPLPAGLPIGTPAPSFDGLEDLRLVGREVLLIFTDPHCQPCTALLPEIRHWQREHAATLKVAVLSRKSVKASDEWIAQHDLVHVVFQQGNEVADLYGVSGTPAGVLIRGDGTISAPVALGRDAIAQLLHLHTAGATV